LYIKYQYALKFESVIFSVTQSVILILVSNITYMTCIMYILVYYKMLKECTWVGKYLVNSLHNSLNVTKIVIIYRFSRLKAFFNPCSCSGNGIYLIQYDLLIYNMNYDISILSIQNFSVGQTTWKCNYNSLWWFILVKIKKKFESKATITFYEHLKLTFWQNSSKLFRVRNSKKCFLFLSKLWKLNIRFPLSFLRFKNKKKIYRKVKHIFTSFWN